MASVKTRYELKLPVLFSVKRQTGHIFANLSQGDKLMKSRGVQDSLKTVDILEFFQEETHPCLCCPGIFQERAALNSFQENLGSGLVLPELESVATLDWMKWTRGRISRSSYPYSLTAIRSYVIGSDRAARQALRTSNKILKMRENEHTVKVHMTSNVKDNFSESNRRKDTLISKSK